MMSCKLSSTSPQNGDDLVEFNDIGSAVTLHRFPPYEVSPESDQKNIAKTSLLFPKNIQHATNPAPQFLCLSSDNSDGHKPNNRMQPGGHGKAGIPNSPRGVKDLDEFLRARISSRLSDADDDSLHLPSLQGNLMTCHTQEEAADYYQILEVLGEGSMGTVFRVKKRAEAIGGSARTSFVRKKSKKANKSWTIKKMCFLFCPFAIENNPKSRSNRNIFQALPFDEDETQVQQQPPPSPLAKFGSRSNSGRSKLISRTGRRKELVFALKTINLDRFSSSDFRKELQHEVDILKDLDHPNIVRPIETFNSHNQLSIVEEICDGGDLYSRDPYDEEDAARIVKSVFGAVAYIHSKNIIHRDIKYENILFTSNAENADVKLIDFGLSKRYSGESYLHDAVGTMYTMAPELLRGNYTSSIDVWSMGVVSFMLLSSSMPFYGNDRRELMQKIVRGKYKFDSPRWKFISRNARNFVYLLLNPDPKKRPTAEQVLKNLWFDQYCNEPKKSTTIDMDNVLASIQTFSGYTKLKKLALMIVGYKSTSQEIGSLRQIFDKFDVSKDGVITFSTFKSTLKEYFFSDEELERVFKGMDIDGDGTVNYSEFLAATIEAHGSIDEERLAESFDRLDSDNSGYITVCDLRKFLGDDVPTAFLEATLDAVVDTIDHEHDHRVSYDKFLAMWDHMVDEQRIADQVLVKQRRIRCEDLKQRVGYMTPNSGKFEFLRLKDMDDLVRCIPV